MRLVAKSILAAMAMGQICSAPAFAAEAQSFRVVSSDGAFAITFPCAKDDIAILPANHVTLTTCQVSGASYLFTLGYFPGAGGGAGKPPYQELLQAFKKSPPSGGFKELAVGGHRAVWYSELSAKTISMTEIVDLGQGKILTIMAGDKKGGALSAEGRQRLLDGARYFIDSLEILAK